MCSKFSQNWQLKRVVKINIVYQYYIQCIILLPIQQPGFCLFYFQLRSQTFIQLFPSKLEAVLMPRMWTYPRKQHCQCQRLQRSCRLVDVRIILLAGQNFLDNVTLADYFKFCTTLKPKQMLLTGHAFCSFMTFVTFSAFTRLFLLSHLYIAKHEFRLRHLKPK